MTTSDQAATGRCAWCAAPASDGQTHCSACGAILAQRETVGILVIPGVTHVDPNLQSYAAQPMRIAGASPSQSAAAGVIEALATGGGPGLAALGALAAAAATEYLSGNRSRTGMSPSTAVPVQPSQTVLDMVQRLDTDSAIGAAGAVPSAYAVGQPTHPVRTESFNEMLKRLDARLADGVDSERGNEVMPADPQ